MSNDLKQAYLQYFEKIRKTDARILSYSCPRCKASIETRVPSNKEESWNSLVVCPHCEELHFKVARYECVVVSIQEVFQ